MSMGEKVGTDGLFHWDDIKNMIVTAEHGYGLEDVVVILYSFFACYVHERYPEQNRCIGPFKGRLITLVIEDVQEDEGGGWTKLITWWPATYKERRLYHEQSS